MQYTRLIRKFPLFIVCTLLLSPPVFAAQVPDAGSLLKELSKPPGQPVAPQKLEPPKPIEHPTKPGGPKVLVKGFRILGALLIGEAELQSQLQPAIDKELTFAQLQTLALKMVGYYASKGYVARVILPPQDIVDGIVELQVIEGKRGSLNIDNKGKLIDSARVQGFIDQRLPNGSAMDLARLGEAMNILNDQPGIEANAAMTKGQGEGDIDLVVTAVGKPYVASDIVINNEGSHGTGETQTQGTFTVNNPTGRFDAASLLVSANKGSTFVRGDYGTAVGDAGLRMGVNASDLSYDVIQSTVSALDPHGIARTYGFNASYPLSFREDFKLSLTGSYDDKTLVDSTSAGETSNKKVRVTSLGLSGLLQPGPTGFLAGGTTTYGVSVNLGYTEQRNAGALASDSATRQTDGRYRKLSYNFGHIRPITNTWSVNTSLRGQLASKNLNSTETFSLGGPKGVRAYPVGEASGDEGWLLNVDLRRKINEVLDVTIFADAGGIKVNDATWANWNAGNTRLKNHYELYGVGAGYDMRIMPNALLSASIAKPIGINPGSDGNNYNVDGQESNRLRSWLSLHAQF